MEMKDWILSARRYAKLTQEQLGERLGMSKANVSAWENGRHEASLEQLIRIKEATAFAEPLPGLQTQKTPTDASEPIILSADEQTLLSAFRALAATERGYLLEDARKYLGKKPDKY